MCVSVIAFLLVATNFFEDNGVWYITDDILKNILCDVSDANKTFHAILSILQDIFVNEASVQRVFNMAVSPSTVLVCFCDFYRPH